MKGLEYFIQIFWIDSNAVVLHFDNQLIVFGSQADGNHPTVGIAKFYGIRNDIHHDLDQPVAITGHPGHMLREIQVNGDVFVINELSGAVDGVVDDLF